MSWIAVDFNLVRYSPIEGTHWFYDSSYSSVIQFLVDGRWQSWDVGWVARHAHDSEIRQLAEDAESRLIRDSTSGYASWPPSTPTQLSPVAGGRRSSQVISIPTVRDNESSAPTTATMFGFQPQNHRSQSPIVFSPIETAGPSQRTLYISPYGGGPTTPTGSASSQIQQTLHEQEHRGPDPVPYIPPDPDDIPTSPMHLKRNRETKILLSLDGDGIRGLSAVLLVESLVNAICSKIGHRVDAYQIFDLIGGVSNGGLLAIMIGRLRMRVHEAREAYMSIAHTVFLDKLRFFSSFDPLAPPASQDTLALEKCLKELVKKEVEDVNETFFDSRPDSANVFVLSTKVEIGKNQAALIRSYPTRRMAGPELDANLTSWEAMHGTIAAPTYIDPNGGRDRKSVIAPGLVDYGMAKNNPIRDLFYECRKLYSYANDTMIVVSIGTGSGLNREREVHDMANSVQERKAEAGFAGEKFEADMRELRERGWMKYFRFNVPDLHDIPLNESGSLDQVKEKTHAYLAIPEIGQRFYDCIDAIVGLLLNDGTGPSAQ